MRQFLALLISASVLAGPAFAECCCEYSVSGVGPVERRVSTISSDGYFMQNGKVMVFRNGGVSELTQEITLDDGSRIQVDGTVLLRDGSRRNLVNNQWIFVDGRFSEAIRNDAQPQFRADLNRDGYFRENGRTFVMRNGTRSEVTAEVTFDNGSKLLPDGTLVMKDGTRTDLREGQRMAFDGSMRQRELERTAEPEPQNASRDRFNEGNKPSTNNAQPGEPHRDRGATQSSKDAAPSSANDNKNAQPSDNKGRDLGATQSSKNAPPSNTENKSTQPGEQQGRDRGAKQSQENNKPAEIVPDNK